MGRIAALVVLLIAPPALADWSGTISARQLGGGPQGASMTGTMRAKKDRVRFDYESPMKMTMIIDPAKKVMYQLNDAARTYTEMDLARAQAQQPYPACGSGDVDACLAQQGYRKSGSGEVNGHACDVYERGPAEGRPGTDKLWRPRDLKEVPMVRLVHKDGERVMQMDLVDIQTAPLADALFEIPKGYAKQEGFPMPGMGGPGGPGGRPGIPAMPPGMTPEQYRDMLMKQYGGKK